MDSNEIKWIQMVSNEIKIDSNGFKLILMDSNEGKWIQMKSNISSNTF